MTFWEVDIWEVDILRVDISGVDILGVDILKQGEYAWLYSISTLGLHDCLPSLEFMQHALKLLR